MKHRAMLSLYAATGPHDETVIVGTREGLERLSRAVRAALDDGQATTGHLWHAPDMEGFEVVVVKAPPERLLAMPAHYAAHRSAAVFPAWLTSATVTAFEAQP